MAQSKSTGSQSRQSATGSQNKQSAGETEESTARKSAGKADKSSGDNKRNVKAGSKQGGGARQKQGGR